MNLFEIVVPPHCIVSNSIFGTFCNPTDGPLRFIAVRLQPSFNVPTTEEQIGCEDCGALVGARHATDCAYLRISEGAKIAAEIWNCPNEMAPTAPECTCPLTVLIASGCQCGAMQK